MNPSDKTSSKLSEMTRVKQGCILAPTLFSAVAMLTEAFEESFSVYAKIQV